MREISKFIEATFPKNIRLRMEIPNEIGLVNGDATQLHQVLMNLCINARDAMPEGGDLVLGLKSVMVDTALARTIPNARVGPHLMLWVSDSGIGIDPEHLDKIFDPFFTTKAPGEGTGLGLSTVLAIARGHDGFVRVESQIGEGTTFFVYLPTIPERPEPARGGPPPNCPRGHGELILVVDDEAQIRHLAREILEHHDYRCIEAENGQTALDIFASRRSPVRAVITDLMMPAMDGAALIRALREIDPEVPIVAISGFLAQPDLLHAVEAHVQHFLSKPFTAADLLQALALAMSDAAPGAAS